MIGDKDIEEAARLDDKEYYDRLSDNDKCFFEYGFRRGYNRALKDLWHDTIEEPKEKVPLLYYRKHKFLPFMVDKHSDVYDWNALIYNFDITKWLYIEDVFPKEGGENG